MQNKILVVTIVLFLLLLPSISAISITSVDFYAGENPVIYISPNRAQAVTLHFDINYASEESMLSSLIMDLTPINPDPMKRTEYSSKNVDLSTCHRNENNETGSLESMNCVVPSLILVVSQSNVEIPVTATFENGTIQQFNISKSFTIDNSNPEVLAIKTPYCIGDTCYIPSNRLFNYTVELRDTVGSFNQRKIFVSTGAGNPRIVQNCTSSSCFGQDFRACSSNEQVRMTISQFGNIPSSDDAGNPLRGNLQTNMICDELPPGGENGEVEINITGPSQLYPEILKSGDVVTIKARIYEDVTNVKAKLNATQLNGRNELVAGNCLQIDTSRIFECTWNVQNVIDGDHIIKFYFEDLVEKRLGYTTNGEITREVHVDYYERSGNVTVPKFFSDITAELVPSNGINRIALGLAMQNGIRFPVFAKYAMRLTGQGGHVKVLYQEIADDDLYGCYLDLPNGTLIPNARNIVIPRIGNPLADFNEENKISLEFRGYPNDVPDEFNLICNVSVRVREDNRIIYETPTKFEVTIPVKMKNSALGNDPPGEKHAKRIKKEEAAISKYSRYIDLMDKLYGTAVDICNIKKYAGNGQFVGTSIETIGFALNNEASEKAGGKIFKLFGNMQGGPEGTYTSKIAKFIDDVCDYTTCNIAERANTPENRDSWYFSGGYNVNDLVADTSDGDSWGASIENSFQSDWNTALTNISIPDVRNSMYAAYRTKCLPAMFMHVQKYQQASCQHLLCLKNNAKYGLDVSVCDYGKAMYTCNVVVGEAFELPYVRQSKNLADNLNAMVQNLIPNTLKAVFTKPFCYGGVDESDPNQLFREMDNGEREELGFAGRSWLAVRIFACHLPESIARAQDFTNRKSASSGQFSYPRQESICPIALCNEDEEGTTSCGSTDNSYFSDVIPFQIPGAGTLELGVEPRVVGEREFEELYSNAERGDEDALEQMVRYFGASDSIIDNEDGSRISELDRIKHSFDIASSNVENPSGGNSENTPERSVVFDPISNTFNVEYSNYMSFLNAKQSFSRESTAVVSRANDFKEKSGFDDLDRALEYARDNMPDEYARYERALTQQERAKAEMDLAINNYVNDIEREYINRDCGTSNPGTDCNQLTVDYNELVVPSRAQATIDSNSETIRTRLDELSTPTQQYATVRELYDDMMDLRSRRDSLNPEELQRLNSLQDSYTELLDLSIENSRLSTEARSGTSPGSLLNERAEEAKLQARTDKFHNNIRKFTDKAILLAQSQGWLNWASITSLGHNSVTQPIVDLAEFTNTYLNSDHWKNQICSMYISSDLGGDHSTEGSVVQCANGVCSPVLTSAAEKIRYNATHYLYTIIYYVGPVRQTDMTINDDGINYNVLLKGPSVTNSIYVDTWHTLRFGRPADDISWSITSPNNYNQICFKFENNFPPEEIGSQREYCRPIVDSTTGGSAFDTGSPVPANYFDPSSGSSSAESSGTSPYNPNI